MKQAKLFLGIAITMAIFTLTGCEREKETIPSESNIVDYNPGQSNTVKGLFILNEGTMGKNNCSLDFFNCTNGTYLTNIYPERNPSIPLALGDAGNNIAIYKNRIFVLVKDFVEVMDAETAKHVGEIKVSACRDIKFLGDKAYISTYSGGKQDTELNSNLGQILEIDVNTLNIERRVDVGFQPEEMAIVNNKIYVANSGGFIYPKYDNRVSVVSLDSFEKIKDITIEVNLHRVEAGNNGKIYVSSRGNYGDIKSDIFVIDTQTDKVTGSLGIPASEMCMDSNMLYITSSEWSNELKKNTIKYAMYDTETGKKVSDHFIATDVEKMIKVPYGIAVNPENKEIFIADAGDYTTPGYIFCCKNDGTLKWKSTAGVIPAHFAFTTINFK